MKTSRKTLVGAFALALMSGAAWAQEDATVAFLMPDQASTRYEQHDFPGFKAEMEKLCPKCTVVYQNANADVALQQQQFNSVIAQGAKVIVLDPVDSAAAAGLVQLAQSQGIKVIAYDRPIPDKPADYYVSFDNEGIGKAIAESLVQHMKSAGVPEGSGVLQINGSPTDAAAGLIRDGIHKGLENSGYQDAGRVRHARLGAAEGTGMGGRPDHPLRRRHQGRRGCQRRHGRRRYCRLQGRRCRIRCRPSPATTRRSPLCS